jgi:hypothetical protein
MIYQLLNEFTGNTLFPSRRWLDREDFYSLSEKAYLLIITLRILLTLPTTEKWADTYLRRTIQHNRFDRWRNNSTDLYVVLWALTQGEYEQGRNVPDKVAEQHFIRWLKALRNKPDEMNETKRLFLKMDSLLHINNGSMKAIRRLVQEWPVLSHRDKQLAMTRLLQFMRSRMQRAESLKQLNKAARSNDLEIGGVCDRETGKGCDVEPHGGGRKINMAPKQKTPGTAVGFLAGLAAIGAGYAASKGLRKLRETSTAGATAASSVATVTKALGDDHPGFDGSGHQGIYEPNRKPRKTAILRRTPPTTLI